MTKHYYAHTISGAIREIEDSIAEHSSLWERTDKPPHCDDYQLDTVGQSEKQEAESTESFVEVRASLGKSDKGKEAKHE